MATTKANTKLLAISRMNRAECEAEIRNHWDEEVPEGFSVLELKQYIKEKREAAGPDPDTAEGEVIKGLSRMKKYEVKGLCEKLGISTTENMTRDKMVYLVKEHTRQEMNPEDTVMTFGKHAHQSFGVIMKEDKAYVEWAIETVMENGGKGIHPLLKKLAEWGDGVFAGEGRPSKASAIKITRDTEEQKTKAQETGWFDLEAASTVEQRKKAFVEELTNQLKVISDPNQRAQKLREVEATLVSRSDDLKNRLGIHQLDLKALMESLDRESQDGAGSSSAPSSGSKVTPQTRASAKRSVPPTPTEKEVKEVTEALESLTPEQIKAVMEKIGTRTDHEM